MDQDGQARGRQVLRGAGVSTPMIGMDAPAESNRTGRAQGAISGAAPDTVREVVDTLLVAEQLLVTFYYAGLTSPPVMRDHRTPRSSTRRPPGARPRRVAAQGSISPRPPSRVWAVRRRRAVS